MNDSWSEYYIKNEGDDNKNVGNFYYFLYVKIKLFDHIRSHLY